MKEVPHLTVNEKILIHLSDFTAFRDQFDVPLDVTQEGIADALGIRLNHVPRAVKSLLATGKLSERTASVSGIKRRRKTYFVTESGLADARYLKSGLKKIQVPTISKATSCDDALATKSRITIEELLKLHNGSIRLLEMLNFLQDAEEIDDEFLRAHDRLKDEKGKGKSRVEHLPRLPPQGVFYGRKKELEILLGHLDCDETALVTVCGIEGIGKTSLALKAIEGLRGKKNLLWHRLRDWDTEETVLTALGDFFEELGKRQVKSIAKAKKKRMPGEIISALSKDFEGSDSILFFDGFDSAEADLVEFFPLLLEAAVASGGDAKIFVTSPEANPFYTRQDAEDGKEIVEIALKGLDEESARKLVGDKVSEKEFATAFQFSKGHPLTLKLLKSQELENLVGEERLTRDELLLLKYLKATKDL